MTSGLEASLSNSQDILPCSVVKGNSPIIIAGPHNGHVVPKSLYDSNNLPLGLHPLCFDPTSPFKRHEACDWGVANLFEVLQYLEKEESQNHNYISSPYSRLVCDLSRSKDNAVTEKSSENQTIISGNFNLDDKDKATRIKQFYTPYQQQLKDLIKDTRAHFGYAIFLDLHSFTPTWKGANRDIHIGTLACSDNFVEVHIAKYLTAACATHDLNFAAHQPYNLKELPKHRSKVARSIEDNGVWYTGLEIRNDMLSTPEKTQTIAQLILESMIALTAHDNKTVFATKTKILEPA